MSQREPSLSFFWSEVSHPAFALAWCRGKLGIVQLIATPGYALPEWLEWFVFVTVVGLALAP
jgi:hypothetical protein